MQRREIRLQKCKHTFEKGAILNHIKIAKNAKTLAACPVAGCTGKVNPEDLVTDEAMLRRVSACGDMLVRPVLIRSNVVQCEGVHTRVLPLIIRR